MVSVQCIGVCIIGVPSDPSLGSWTEDFVLPCMPVSGIYMYVCTVHSYTREYMDDFKDLN